jgi:endonuclease-3
MAKKPASRGPAPAAEKARAKKVLARLERAIPDWKPTLDFSTPFELLVATILAAQTTDENVNRVTERLFARARTPEAFAAMPQAELEQLIFKTGFFRNKARAIKAVSQDLLDRFRGEVPRDLDALTSLFGVGRKTASIVLGAAFGVPAIAVDRHVDRVSKRLGFVPEREKDRDRIEERLRALFPKSDWVKATWLLVLHGRRTCAAKKPDCPNCPVRDLCPYPEKISGVERRRDGQKGRPR